MISMRKRVFLMMLAVICGMSTQAIAAKRNKHRFFLLTAYTQHEEVINKEKFTSLYNKLVMQGVVVYRNGQTYKVMVPLKQLYRKGTVQYTDKGKVLVSDLSAFLQLYDIELMKVTGYYVEKEKVAEAKEEMMEAESGLKGDFGKTKVIKSDVQRENRTLDPELVSLKQASRFTSALIEKSPKLEKIDVSVTASYEKNHVFEEGVERKANERMQESSSLFEKLNITANAILAGTDNQKFFEHGAIQIDFKKY
jgi:hypothetical protein